MEETKATLIFDDIGNVEVDYEDRNHLPTTLAKFFFPGSAEVNLAGVLSEDNSNLSPSQKLLLHWHCKFGRKSMS